MSRDHLAKNRKLLANWWPVRIVLMPSEHPIILLKSN